MGKAYGFFEIPSVTAAVVAIDIMCKTADVQLVTWEKKLGGRLVNLEFFMLEIEQDGCPTCPFTPSFVRKYYPYSSAVYQRENSYIFTICEPLPGQTLRIRLKADNTHQIIAPALSEIITLTPSAP